MPATEPSSSTVTGNGIKCTHSSHEAHLSGLGSSFQEKLIDNPNRPLTNSWELLRRQWPGKQTRGGNEGLDPVRDFAILVGSLQLLIKEPTRIFYIYIYI